MFSQIAPRYDFLNSFLSLRQDHAWRQKTVRIVTRELNRDYQVLDVCTGTAELALTFRRKSNNRVIGTDFALPMLKIARDKLKQKVPSNDCYLSAADTCRLPFKDNSFAVCSIAFGLRNLVDLSGGLKEMFRVLIPGGRLAILEFSLPRPRRGKPLNNIFASLYLFYFTRILPRLGNMISRSRMAAYSYLPESVLSFPDKEKMVKLLSAHGARQIEVYPMSGGIVNLYVARKG